jgi:tetratricopeptide (TPR) repeat protein
LVDQAAIWTHFQLVGYLEAHKNVISRLRNVICRPRNVASRLRDGHDKKKKDDLSLTKKWKSHAYFRAGVRWMLKDKKGAARQMFVEALNQDTNNLDALFNLGVLDTEEKEHERALKRLERVKEKADTGATQQVAAGKSPGLGKEVKEKADTGATQQDPKIQRYSVWHKAAYQLAATNFYCALAKPDQDKYYEDAEKEAGDLLREINQVSDSPEEGKLQERDKALKEFLKQFLPLVKAMYPGILYGLNKELPSPTFLLPISSIKTELTSLKPEEGVVIVVAVERKDPQGNIVEYKTHRYDDAKLIAVLDENNESIDKPPHKKAVNVRISLPFDTAVNFAGQLADLEATYCLLKLKDNPSGARQVSDTDRQDKCVKSGGWLGRIQAVLEKFGLDLTIQAE